MTDRGQDGTDRATLCRSSSINRDNWIWLITSWVHTMRKSSITALLVVGFAVGITTLKHIGIRPSGGRHGYSAGDRTIWRLAITALAIDAYRVEFGKYPQSLGNVAACSNAHAYLASLSNHPSGSFVDEWGRSFLYTPRGDTCTLASRGRDGVIGTDDDIARPWDEEHPTSKSSVRGIPRR